MALGELLRLVKNLRGVVFAASAEGLPDFLSWFARKFQYRSVGFPPSLHRLAEEAGAAERLDRKPFEPLTPPTAAAEELIEAFCGNSPLAEALFLASAHIAPLFLLGEQAARAAGRLAVATLDSPLLSDAEAKRHLRILDYAILDAHGASSERSAKALVEAARRGDLAAAKRRLTSALKAEAAFAQDDCHTRFWRLVQAEGTDRVPTVLYLHPLTHVRKALDGELAVSVLARLADRQWEELALCLSVVPAWVVRLPRKG